MIQNIYLCTVTKISFRLENRFFITLKILFETLITFLPFNIILSA